MIVAACGSPAPEFSQHTKLYDAYSCYCCKPCKLVWFYALIVLTSCEQSICTVFRRAVKLTQVMSNDRSITLRFSQLSEISNRNSSVPVSHKDLVYVPHTH